MMLKVFAAVAATASASLLKKSEGGAGEVYLSDNKIFGAGVSNPSMQCERLGGAAVKSSTEPRFKVVGVNMKVKVFLKNDCQEYKSVEVGSCDSSQPASTAVEMGPQSDGAPVGMAHFQSYQIMYCSA